MKEPKKLSKYKKAIAVIKKCESIITSQKRGILNVPFRQCITFHKDSKNPTLFRKSLWR